jgi:hypothetical protein
MTSTSESINESRDSELNLSLTIYPKPSKIQKDAVDIVLNNIRKSVFQYKLYGMVTKRATKEFDNKPEQVNMTEFEESRKGLRKIVKDIKLVKQEAEKSSTNTPIPFNTKLKLKPLPMKLPIIVAALKINTMIDPDKPQTISTVNDMIEFFDIAQKRQELIAQLLLKTAKKTKSLDDLAEVIQREISSETFKITVKDLRDKIKESTDKKQKINYNVSRPFTSTVSVPSQFEEEIKSKFPLADERVVTSSLKSVNSETKPETKTTTETKSETETETKSVKTTETGDTTETIDTASTPSSVKLDTKIKSKYDIETDTESADSIDSVDLNKNKTKNKRVENFSNVSDKIEPFQNIYEYTHMYEIQKEPVTKSCKCRVHKCRLHDKSFNDMFNNIPLSQIKTNKLNNCAKNYNDIENKINRFQTNYLKLKNSDKSYKILDKISSGDMNPMGIEAFESVNKNNSVKSDQIKSYSFKSESVKSDSIKSYFNKNIFIIILLIIVIYGLYYLTQCNERKISSSRLFSELSSNTTSPNATLSPTSSTNNLINYLLNKTK